MFQREGRRVIIHVDKGRSLRNQTCNIALCQIGLNQRKHIVQKLIQLGDTQLLQVLHRSQDHLALPLHTVPVIIDCAKSRIAHRCRTVQVIDARNQILLHLLLHVHSLDVASCKGSFRVIDVIALRFGHIDIYAADRIHQLHEGPDVDTNVLRDIHLEILANLPRHQVRTAVPEHMRQPVPLPFVFSGRDLHTDGTLKADQMYLIRLTIDGQKNAGIASCIVIKLRGAVIGSDQKDIEYRLILLDLARCLNCLFLFDFT